MLTQGVEENSDACGKTDKKRIETLDWGYDGMSLDPLNDQIESILTDMVKQD